MRKRAFYMLGLAIAVCSVVAAYWVLSDARLISSSHTTHDRPSIHIRMDPNTADVQRLSLIPGIGPKIAERIITQREIQPFENIDDMSRRVTGIGRILSQRLEAYLYFPNENATQDGK